MFEHKEKYIVIKKSSFFYNRGDVETSVTSVTAPRGQPGAPVTKLRVTFWPVSEDLFLARYVN